MTSQTSRATRTGLAALGVALLSALAAGCSSAGTVTVEQAPPPAPAIQAGARPQAGADAVTTAKGTPDRLAPSTYRPVIRNGRAPHPSIAPKTGNAGALRSVAYKDGVTVTVTRVTQGVETGQGPGVFAGRPHTALTLTVVNRSAKALDLSQVVVTALYGSPARLAAPVYEDAAARDFTGTLKPGATATATYVFSVPTASVKSLVAIVDVDATHVAARVKGA